MGRSSERKLSNTCVFIIVIASVERFAYKGVVSNLVSYLTDVMKMKTSAAAKTVNVWCGFTSILPLLGALFGDTYWDRYSTILASSFLYILGLMALTIGAFLSGWFLQNRALFFISLFFSLYLVSLGQGGYNPCLQAFGADQIEDNEDELPCTIEENDNQEKKSLYFHWWYFGICSGSLLGVTVMSYIQDNFGWVLGFAIPAMAMVISFLCFYLTTRYNHKQSKLVESPFQRINQSIKATARRLVKEKISLPSREDKISELELQEAALKSGKESSVKCSNGEEDVAHGGNFVIRLLPIWSLLLTFAVIFQQPATFFTKQGMTMNRTIGSFVIPPATLQSSITISIILLMPLYNKLLIPAIRLITKNEKEINVLQRMGIGMFFSVLSMAIAALVEGKRKQKSKNLKISATESMGAQLSIFWLLPQYTLLGISDVFTVVGMQEFFYAQTSARKKTMGIALYLSVFGVGSFLSVFLISLIEFITGSLGHNQSWFSDDINEGKLDYYYWLLASSGSINLLILVYLSENYLLKKTMEDGSIENVNF